MSCPSRHLQRPLPVGTLAVLPHDPRGADGIYVRFDSDNLDIPVCSPGQCGKCAVNNRRIENNERLPACIFECPGNRFDHVHSPIEERGIVLDKDNCVAGLAERGEELVGGKTPADIKVFGLPVDPRQDPGVVASDIEEEEPLEIRVAVECVDHHLFRCDHGVESTRLECQALAELDLHRPGSLLH